MSAYVVVLVEKITNPEEIDEYRRIGKPSMMTHKPEVLVLAQPAETLEGTPVEGGVVMLRFPTMKAAKDWYNSPDYQEALQHRFAGAKCHAVLVDDGKSAS